MWASMPAAGCTGEWAVGAVLQQDGCRLVPVDRVMLHASFIQFDVPLHVLFVSRLQCNLRGRPAARQCHVQPSTHHGCTHPLLPLPARCRRGAISAAAELVAGTRPWEERGWDAPWVTFCLKLIGVLQGAGVTPVLVFDGRRLPAKADTNAGRRQRRQDARERAQRLMQEASGRGRVGCGACFGV